MPRRDCNVDNFVHYNAQTNISRCKICSKTLLGRRVGNIKRHYFLVHKQKLNKFWNGTFEIDATACKTELDREPAGRKRIYHHNHRFDIYKYISFNPNNNTSTCLKCEKVLLGKISSNIKRHYLLIHGENIDKNEENDETAYQQNNETNYQNDESEMNDEQQNIDDYNCNKSNEITNCNEFLLCCLGMVTMNNIPIKVFDDSEYFKKLLIPYENKFNLNLDSENLLDYIDNAAGQIKENISNEIKTKNLCLKADYANKMGTKLLCISVQYTKDYKIINHTIGSIQLNNLNTEKFLQDNILNLLNDFNINKDHIYMCVTDLDVYSSDVREMDDGNISNDIYYDEYENIYKIFKSILPNTIKSPSHILNLAANDLLSCLTKKIDECRIVIKNLHDIIQKIDDTIELPALGNLKRWTSIYEMVKSLHLMRIFLENSETTNIINNWEFIIGLENALKPLIDCFEKFNTEQYTIGDYYRDLLCCEIELEEINETNNYADLLLDSLKQNKEKLLVNKAFVAGLYVDPRFNFLNTPFLTNEQKSKALALLIQAQTKISPKNQTDNIIIEMNTDLIVPSTSRSSLSKLEAKMKSIGAPISLSEVGIQKKLENLQYGPRISFDTDVLEYWLNINSKDPDLQKLIEIILSVPATQFTINKAQNSISLISTNLESQLSNETINNLLLVNMNSSLLNNIVLDKLVMLTEPETVLSINPNPGTDEKEILIQMEIQ